MINRYIVFFEVWQFFHCVDSTVDYVITLCEICGFLVFRYYYVYVGESVGVHCLLDTAHIVLYSCIEEYC